jgi:hypothetical protein
MVVNSLTNGYSGLINDPGNGKVCIHHLFEYHMQADIIEGLSCMGTLFIA